MAEQRIIAIDLNDISTTLYEDTLIRQGESKASKLEITLSPEFEGYDYVLVFQTNDNVPYATTQLTPVQDPVTLLYTLEYEVTNAVTFEAGYLRVELQAFEQLTSILVKTCVFTFKIKRAIEGTAVQIPSDYEVYIQLVEHYMDRDIYDPQGIYADAFDMDNMTDGLAKVAMTLAERIKLTNLPTDGFGTGDMTKTMYDPNLVEDDAFDMANMVEAPNAKILTASERVILDSMAVVDVNPTPNTMPIRNDEGGIAVDEVVLDLTPVGLLSEGKIQWNPNRHTADVGLTGVQGIAMQVCQDVLIWAKNISGQVMPVGTAVAIAGTSDGLPSIMMADADSSPAERNCIGVIAGYTIPIGGMGYVSLAGLISNITTIDWNEGDVLYLSSEAGRITNVAPAFPSVPVTVGWCIKQAGAGLGQIYVKVSVKQIAEEVPLRDSGLLYTATDIEGALAEIAGRLKPAYAEIYTFNNLTPQSVPNGATYTKLTTFMANGASSNCTADASNQRIVIGVTGAYKITFGFSSTVGSNGKTLETTIFKNDSEVQNIHTNRYIQSANTMSSVSRSGIVNCLAGDILDIRVRHNDTGAMNVVTAYGNLNVERLVG